MSSRDRMIVLVLAAVAVLAAGYIAVVSPERSRASKLEAKVESAKSTLSAADAKLSQARAAESRYASAYANIVSLGQAVPADQEVPSLVYEVNHAAGKAKVSFQSISAGSASAASSASTGETAAPVFQSLPFTFSFQGSFFQLYHLMRKLQGFTVSMKSGGVAVSGRLLTIQGLNLTGGGGSTAGAGSGGEHMTGTVTATAYVLPPGQSLTAGATSSGPAGTSSASAPATSAASTGTSVTAPAIVKANP